MSKVWRKHTRVFGDDWSWVCEICGAHEYAEYWNRADAEKAARVHFETEHREVKE